MTTPLTDETPLRGEIWLAVLGAARPGETGKTRPVVVVSNDSFAPYGQDHGIVVVPLSTSRAPSMIRPAMDPGQGLKKKSVAVVRSVRGMARSRLVQRLGKVPSQTMRQVDQALADVLDLPLA